MFGNFLLLFGMPPRFGLGPQRLFGCSAGGGGSVALAHHLEIGYGYGSRQQDQSHQGRHQTTLVAGNKQAHLLRETVVIGFHQRAGKKAADFLGQVHGRSVTFCRILFHGVGTHGSKGGRRIGFPVAYGNGRLPGDFLHSLFDRGTGIGFLAGDNLIENDAKGIHIRAFIDTAAVPCGLFRRHIQGRSHHRAGKRDITTTVGRALR
ncbi:MAG: hypothetical protein BWY09_01085 [Candidatus Hydrogenedentes bacterium ADurb.Bin179]|nr:MAG: hypothetical protein BWY09_01085 [Candidatus Hydrogenedentes bacterium ADurb.Bin179]